MIRAGKGNRTEAEHAPTAWFPVKKLERRLLAQLCEVAA